MASQYGLRFFVVEDRYQISQLVHEYAACIDRGDLDGVAALFAQWRISIRK
jgi:SnoaL-like domain